MKKMFFLLLVTFLFACTNPEGTDTTRPDSTIIEKDNTINRDTGIKTTDTTNRRDSIK